MIKQLAKGKYQLLETKGEIKILLLGSGTYAWVDLEGIGEILVTSQKPHQTDTALSVGHYRLYEVEDEPKLSDQQHLELSIGNGRWQGYLLPTGLPNGKKTRSRVIPTKEVITSSKITG
jgi:hypothetical protein